MSRDLARGTVLDARYRIEGRLGIGGMGTVFCAEHLAVGRAVAIKVLAPAWSRHASVRQRFMDEARVASATRHPGIVEVFDIGELPDGRPYLVMEKVDGIPLSRWSQQRPSAAAVSVARIGRRLADALLAVHSAGIVHRDLKPDNVFVIERDDDVFIKLLDFGIAYRDSHTDSRRTVPGTVMGTPEYMAPEQGLGKAASPTFDVYALGVVLYELLSGRLPFELRDEDPPTAVVIEKARVRAPSIATLRPDVPQDLVAVIDACLERRPVDRPTMRQVRDRLADLEAGPVRRIPPHASASEEARRAASRWAARRIDRKWIFASGLLVAFITALGLVEPTAVAAYAMRPVAAMLDVSSLAGAGSVVEPAARRAPEISNARVEALEVATAPRPAPRPEVETIATPVVAEPAVHATSVAVAEPTPPADTMAAPTKAARASRPTARRAKPDRAPSARRGSSLPPPPPSTARTLPPPEATVAASVCEAAHLRADEARLQQDWTGLLAALQTRACWPDSTARRRLRTQAFMEMGRFGECVQAGAGVEDRTVERWVHLCRARSA